MLLSPGRFRLNHERATGKVIEDEAVLVNVVTGRYYSLCDAGCVAWVYLSRGSTLEQAVAAITDRFDVDASTATDDLAVLAQELLAEELLVKVDKDEPLGSPTDQILPPHNDVRLPYTAMRLETFTDMEDLLTFDPPLPRVPEEIAQVDRW